MSRDQKQPRVAATKVEGVPMSVGSPTHGYRELAYRATDGLEVVLFWHQPTDQLTVSVSDERTGAYFQLRAGAGEALKVFEHPYAYAAARGVPYNDAATSLDSGVHRQQGEPFAQRLKR
jgi:hypothetical protein